MLQHIPFPALPAPPSWFPGHMTQFTRMLPGLLRRTDVVLELRDARLPLTSINRNFEGKPDACSPAPASMRCGWRPREHPTYHGHDSRHPHAAVAGRC